MTINKPFHAPPGFMAQRHSAAASSNTHPMQDGNLLMPLSPPITPEQGQLATSDLPFRPKRQVGAQLPNRSMDRNTSRSPASNAALSNPEILENILYHVNSRTLLHCTRVTKAWFDVIRNSPHLRRNLWVQLPTSDRLPRPYLNPFFTFFRSNLAINAWIKRRYSDATDYVIRFACKSKLANLGRGSWRDMLVFWPSERAVGELIVQVEDEDTPCVYDVFPMTMDWSQTVTMGALVDLILAS
ncbi:hypothetical protein CKM354_000482700 [Cercospora kikuchii]|uniref:F-box domain-containing protein n=1 Tax=Cercospora kikuchii TaxID=84275 RepID=A0A9P3CJC1_9PEZI|nr:uncharacterized protein CKM354_000482700 [Cercospora kikuchii]GIZ41525.1 hypothetical protein CKM354_000482700 [Cercospora kikuchii]